jgi:hypothetical protein
VTAAGDHLVFSTTDDTGWSLWNIGVDGSNPRLVVAGTMHG